MWLITADNDTKIQNICLILQTYGFRVKDGNGSVCIHVRVCLSIPGCFDESQQANHYTIVKWYKYSIFVKINTLIFFKCQTL